MENGKVDEKTTPNVPDLDTMKKAAKLDLDAAVYFLTALRAHPEIVEKFTEELHNFYTQTPAAIDAVTKLKGNGAVHSSSVD